MVRLGDLHDFVTARPTTIPPHPHPGRTLFEDVDLGLFRDATVGIVGPNGAGKSTLLQMFNGQKESMTEGAVWCRDGITVTYLPQEPALRPPPVPVYRVVGHCTGMHACL